MRVKLGDLSIPMRPWPTPDPEKCAPSDIIATLCKTHGGPPGLPPFINTYWPMAPGSRLGPGWVDRDLEIIEDQLDDEEGTSPGWFWVSEAAPLPWIFTGSSKWSAVGGYSINKLTEGFVLYGVGDPQTFETLKDAQQVAANHERDIRTRRTLTP